MRYGDRRDARRTILNDIVPQKPKNRKEGKKFIVGTSFIDLAPRTVVVRTHKRFRIKATKMWRLTWRKMILFHNLLSRNIIFQKQENKNISHAALRDFRGHQKRFDGVDVKIVVDVVRRNFTILAFRTVKRICIKIAINWRHFNVTVWCDWLRFRRRRQNRWVGWHRCGLFESRVLIDKLIILKRWNASFK